MIGTGSARLASRLGNREICGDREDRDHADCSDGRERPARRVPARAAARGRARGRRPGAGTTRASGAGVPLRPVDLTDAGAIDAALAEADPEVDHPRGGPEHGRGGPPRPGAGRAVNVEATARLADWCARPRPAAGLHLDRPGLRRLAALEPRGRPGRADPGLRPDQARGRAGRPGGPRRPGRPAQPALRAVAVRAAPTSSTGPLAALRPGRAADVLRGRVPHAARPGDRRRDPRPAGRRRTRPGLRPRRRAASGSAGST